MSSQELLTVANGDENGTGPIKSRWGMMTFAHSFNIGHVPLLSPLVSSRPYRSRGAPVRRFQK